FSAGNNLALGWMTDGVYVNGSGIELTTVWNANAGYLHYWTPTFSTAVLAGYANISYDAQAASYFADVVSGASADNTCATAQTAISFGLGPTGANTCNPNWSFIETGVKSTWTPAPGLTFSVSTMYNYIWSGFKGGGTIL